MKRILLAATLFTLVSASACTEEADPIHDPDPDPDPDPISLYEVCYSFGVAECQMWAWCEQDVWSFDCAGDLADICCEANGFPGLSCVNAAVSPVPIEDAWECQEYVRELETCSYPNFRTCINLCYDLNMQDALEGNLLICAWTGEA